MNVSSYATGLILEGRASRSVMFNSLIHKVKFAISGPASLSVSLLDLLAVHLRRGGHEAKTKWKSF